MKTWSALGILVAWTAGAAMAAPVPLPAQGRFVVFEASASEALNRFCQATRLRCVIDPAVSGTIHGHFGAATPRAFLDRIMDDYHIDAYDDGAALYLTPARASTARSFALDGVPYAALLRGMRTAGTWDDHFPVRAAADGRSVDVFGPPRLLELVGQTISGMKQSGGSTVTIIRGSAVQTVTVP